MPDTAASQRVVRLRAAFTTCWCCFRWKRVLNHTPQHPWELLLPDFLSVLLKLAAGLQWKLNFFVRLWECSPHPTGQPQPPDAMGSVPL